MSKTIHITEPKSGEVTSPLQAHQWSRDHLETTSAGSSIYDLMEVDADRTAARPVTVRWSGGSDVPSDITVSLHYDGKIRELSPSRAGYIELHHLHVGKMYEVAISCSDGSASEPVQFSTHSDLPRWITVPGTTNVRDCGGWYLAGGNRYRQGALYRGAEMNTHLSIAPEGARVFLNELGIKTIIDLRGAYGGSENPQSPFPGKDAHWINVPLLPYELISDFEQKAYYRQTFQILADPSSYPAYFHCWGGADRTGTVAYLLGAFLGMDQEDLLTDYELTSFSLWGVRSRESSYFVPFYEEISAYGDNPQDQATHYFQEIGLSMHEMEQLKSNLVEKDKA